MLVLKRRAGQDIVIAGTITVKVIEAEHGWVRLGIEAPKDVIVDRKEVHEMRGVGFAPTDGRAAK